MVDEAEPPIVEAIHLTVEDERNVHSQSGEDGIIARILDLYGVRTGRAVDIGAWDGVYLSNTATLRDNGWTTCLIEADYTRYKQCCALPNTVCVHRMVTPENVDKLISERFPDVDLLSLDIDGDDIWVFDALVSFRPRIVVIEYNPTYPPFLSRANPLGTSKGSSLAAIEVVGKVRGYSLVYATISNAILVDESRNNGIIGVKDAFGAFRWDLTRFVVSDFDGANALATISTTIDAVTNPWDGLPAVELLRVPQEMLGFDSVSHRGLRQKWHKDRIALPQTVE